MVHLRKALQLEQGGIISFIGAGGKTSLMYSLAEELVAAGKKVLTTTTTKIYMPANKDNTSLIISRCSEQISKQVELILRDGLSVTLGAECIPDVGKIRGIKPSIIKQIAQKKLFDFILIEADGAAGRPLKASAAHEPVVPDITDKLVIVAGLDVVGKTLTEQYVFRSNLFSEITGLPLNSVIAENHVTSILLHELASVSCENETITNIVFLNKAESPKTMSMGRRILDIIFESGHSICDRIVIGQLQPVPVIYYSNTVRNQCSKL